MTDAERFKVALDAIQEAQNLVDAACRALCSLEVRTTGPQRGKQTAYSIACRLGDRIKEDWHRIEQRRVSP